MNSFTDSDRSHETKKPIHSYKDLIVWQKSMDLVTAIYEITTEFPTDERFGLTSQMRRAAVSIPSNIAEGRRRGTKREYAQFLRISYGSGSELETQIEISKRLSFTQTEKYKEADILLNEIMRMLQAIIKKLQPEQ